MRVDAKNSKVRSVVCNAPAASCVGAQAANPSRAQQKSAEEEVRLPEIQVKPAGVVVFTKGGKING